MTTQRLAMAFPVGEILADELEARGWSQAEFAQIISRPKQFVSEIITGKKELTRESAAQVAAAFGTSPEFWLNIQNTYYLWKQGKDEHTQNELDQVSRRAKLREIAPVGLLQKKGFITSDDVDEQEAEILDLFGKPRLEQPSDLKFAARRSNIDESISMLQETWVACVRKIARNLVCEPYDESSFRKFAESCSIITSNPARFSDLQAMAAECGVKLVYLEAFPGSKFDGCAMSLDGNPVIGLSGRGKRLDKVLFTLLHETAHVLLRHVGEEIILDDFSDLEAQNECEADTLATSMAIDGELPPIPNRIGGEWVNSTAQELGVHPIVVVGRLQKEGRLSWNSILAKGAPNVDTYLAQWDAPKS